MPRTTRRTIAAMTLSLAVAACGSAALRAAESGDLAKLRTEIQERHARGKLTDGEATDLARAVATREITAARSEGDALARLRETRACTRELEDALEERTKTHDGAGADAALSLLDDGALSQGRARDMLDDADDRWRAVGARTLHRKDDRRRRQDAFVDPSPRVRRSAIRAAAEARDATDLDPLMEVARLDPELLLRNEAVRASGAVVRGLDDDVRAPAARTFGLRLRDLFTSGDDAVRQDVAVAWALAPVWENGGRDALRATIGDGKGPGAIAGAGVVARSRGDDAELGPAARAVLARAIREGERRERIQAVATTPLDAATLPALRDAAKDDDGDIRIAALGRLLDSAPDREPAIRDLLLLARPAASQDGRARMLAVRARQALAAAGDLRVQAWVEADLRAAEADRRVDAASALAAMGRPARAAPLLADPDVSVRTRAACTVLGATRR